MGIQTCTHSIGTAEVIVTICTESTETSERRVIDRKDIFVMKIIPGNVTMKQNEVTDAQLFNGG